MVGNSVWDYPSMQNCAVKLDDLRDRSNVNLLAMDQAFDMLTASMDADVGRAFLAAYQEHVGSIKMFTQALDSESKLLRGNVAAMQNADAEIAARIRQTFGV